MSLTSFDSFHDDAIHDISHNYYGDRLATCSSDKTIKIFDHAVQHSDEETALTRRWECVADWRAHQGAVWRVDWAHPEFGTILASCSFDRTVAIWEETWASQVAMEKIAPPMPNEPRNKRNENTKSKWVLRAQLLDSKDSVNSVKFAPKHLGLKLASASEDGHVRVYVASDTMNPEIWQIEEEFEARSSSYGLSSLDWNPSRRFNLPQLMVTSSNGGETFIWMRNDDQRRWFPLFSLSIDATSADGNMLAGNAVHDVAWAPAMGRSFEQIAAATQAGQVVIWRISRKDLEDAVQMCQEKNIKRTDGNSVDWKPIVVTPMAVLKDHQSEVWRVRWNITGTVLASSGDDGSVRMWKASFQNEWRCVTEIKGET